MDLLDTLRSKIDALPKGPHDAGLRAVLLHIETAFGHLTRGQEQDEDTAFTDVIYRTNQAFEGSIKEAYRVLTGKDPSRKTPAEVEKYLEDNKVFRPRVLSQLRNYRTEWRNPSTHEYKLDFDESEAFLAIISVAAFAVLLLDQIAENLSFKQTQADLKDDPTIAALVSTRSKDFESGLESVLLSFIETHPPTSEGRLPEPQLLGSLAAYLTASFPSSNVEVELALNSTARADLVLNLNHHRVVIEVKRTKNIDGSIVQATLSLVERYVTLAQASLGVILFLSPMAESYYTERVFLGSAVRTCIVVRPKNQ